MKEKYGIAAFYDSLMGDFYALVQESEKVPQFSTKMKLNLHQTSGDSPKGFLVMQSLLC